MAKRSASSSDARTVFEDIYPPTHFFSEEKCDRFVVDLSGWKKEKGFDKTHLRVRLDDQRNIIMSGERPISADRSIRFQRVFRLPEGGDSARISAKFYDGILTVVVPKSTPTLSSALTSPLTENKGKDKGEQTPPALTPPLTRVPTPALTEGKAKDKGEKNDGGQNPPALTPALTPTLTQDKEKNEGQKAPQATLDSGKSAAEKRRRRLGIAAVMAAAILMVLLGFSIGKWVNPFLGELPPLESFLEDC